MSTIGEMIVRLLADTTNFNSSMDEAAAKVTASQDAMAASMQASMASFAQFEAIQKGSIKTTDDLAAAQTALNDARASGAFTTEEIAAKEAIVAASMAKVGQETQVASGVLGAFTRNSRTMYTTSALITDAMTGQFSRMRREVAALANETGVMAAAFRLLVGPVGLAVGVVGGSAAAFIIAADHYQKFEQTIESSGDIIGMTAGDLENMATEIGQTTNASFDAVDAVNALGRSGLFTGASLQTASEAAVYFSQVTGEKIGKAAQIIESLQDKPRQAIAKLNDQYHFLDETQAELIVKFLNTGQEAQAAALAVTAFHNAMESRAQQMLADTSALSRDWQGLKGWIEGSAESLASFLNMLGGSSNINDKLNAAYAKLALDKKVLAEYGNNPLGAAFGGVSQSDVNKDIANIDRLRAEQDKLRTSAQQMAASEKEAANTLDQGTHGKHGTNASFSDFERQLQREEAAQRVSYNDRLVFEHDYYDKLANDANVSADIRAQAYRREVDIQNQLDGQSYRSSEEAERKITEAARQAEEKRRELTRKTTADFKEEMRKQAEEAQRTAMLEERDYQRATASFIKEVSIQGEANDRLQKKLVQSYERTYQQIGMTVMGSLNQMIYYHETFRQALANIGLQILQQMEQHWVEEIALYFAKEQAKTTAHAVGTSERTGITAMGEAESLAIQGASAIKWIMTEAAKAAAAAFSAMAGIPIIGPVLAVGASIAAFATVAKLVGSVASAKGGWERVPADGMTTVLHKDEMVLPKHVADPVRQMASNGSSRMPTHIHVNAWDSRSLVDFLKRNPHAFSTALAHAGRNGWG